MPLYSRPYIVRIWERERSDRPRVKETRELTAEETIEFMGEQLRKSEAHNEERDLFDIRKLEDWTQDFG